ncbi:MAG: AEC family transporter [Pseudomonadota bacterium]
MFFSTAATIFNAVFQLLLISCAAGILVRRKMVSQAQIQSLSSVTITIFLPCLIISNVTSQFNPATFALWWTLPLAGILLVLIGLALSALLFRMNPAKRQLLPLASMQNAVYIPLPIVKILYPEQFDTYALYIFLLVLGLTPILWSLGKVLISGKDNTQIHWKDFITPPFVAIIISIFLVFTTIHTFLPSPVMGSIALLGQATVPMAIFVLGATLGSISLKNLPPVNDMVIVNMVKFVLVPAVVFAVLFQTGLYRTMPLFCILVMIQASCPPATNLMLMVKNYGGDSQAIGSMMLIQHLACILALPLWLSLWQMATN